MIEIFQIYIWFIANYFLIMILYQNDYMEKSTKTCLE